MNKNIIQCKTCHDWSNRDCVREYDEGNFVCPLCESRDTDIEVEEDDADVNVRKNYYYIYIYLTFYTD